MTPHRVFKRIIKGSTRLRLGKNFKRKANAEASFRAVIILKKILPIGAFNRVHDFLTRKSWPFVLTEHGFNQSLASYSREDVWAELMPALDLFERRGYEIFLAGGALLGLWRDRELPKFDDDLDVVVYRKGSSIEDAARDHSALRESFPELDWSEHHARNAPNHVFFLKEGMIGVDVFPSWDVNPDFVFIYPSGKLPRDQIFPLIQYSDCGFRLPFPSKPESLLEANYGDWTKPDNAFQFDWGNPMRKPELRMYAEMRRNNL